MLLILWLLCEPTFRERDLLRVLGLLAYVFQFNRPLFSVLYLVYRSLRVFADGASFARLGAGARDELLLACILLPLAECSLRLPVCSVISASDASLHGGAAGVSACVDPSILAGLIRRSEFRGTAVRLDGLPELGRRMTPQVSFPARDFHFHVKHKYKFKHAQHINILEVKAWAAMVRRIASVNRSSFLGSCRFGIPRLGGELRPRDGAANGAFCRFIVALLHISLVLE